MVKRTLFYSYRSGDFHICRSFIRDILNKFPSEQYGYYSCLPLIRQNDIDHVLIDIPKLIKIPPYYNIGSIPSPCYIGPDEVLINVHIDARSIGINSDNCVFQVLYDNFKMVYDQLTLEIEDKLFYLPQIDFSKFQISEIDSFFKDRSNKKRIFVANNYAQSLQSNNFHFNPIITYGADGNKDIDFFITNKIEPLIKQDNIFYIEDIIKKEGNNLNEMAYFSTLCDVLVGRLSGPHSFSLIKENLMNPDKTYVCYNNSKVIAIWMPERLSKVLWTNNYDINNMCGVLKQAIEGQKWIL